MKRFLINLCVPVIGLLVFNACEVETGDPKITQTDAGWVSFSNVEEDLGQVIGLFENTLKLAQEIEGGFPEVSEYFAGETIFKDQKGWWGVMNWNMCRFKAVPLEGQSLTSEGTVWTAYSKYYSDDSITIECTGKNEWNVKGFVNRNGMLRTKAVLQVACVEELPSPDLDSVAFQVKGEGTLFLVENYPATNVTITFAIITPLLRTDNTVYRSYAFMGGGMKLEATDMRTGRKEKALAEIESLPLDERMVRIIARGTTGVHP